MIGYEYQWRDIGGAACAPYRFIPLGYAHHYRGEAEFEQSRAFFNDLCLITNNFSQDSGRDGGMSAAAYCYDRSGFVPNGIEGIRYVYSWSGFTVSDQSFQRCVTPSDVEGGYEIIFGAGPAWYQVPGCNPGATPPGTRANRSGRIHWRPVFA